MQTLKDGEGLLVQVRRDADAIVLYREYAGLPIQAAPDVDLGLDALAPELQRTTRPFLILFTPMSIVRKVQFLWPGHFGGTGKRGGYTSAIIRSWIHHRASVRL
jgi:hypothetical protein